MGCESGLFEAFRSGGGRLLAWVWAKCRGRVIRINLEGECFAKANISAAEAASVEDARIPRAHEDEGRPQGTGGAP